MSLEEQLADLEIVEDREEDAPSMASPTNARVVFATAGFDPVIRLWDVLNGTTLLTLPHPESHVNALSISRDKRTLIAGGFSWDSTHFSFA